MNKEKFEEMQSDLYESTDSDFSTDTQAVEMLVRTVIEMKYGSDYADSIAHLLHSAIFDEKDYGFTHGAQYYEDYFVNSEEDAYDE